jgi:hypothetical protein
MAAAHPNAAISDTFTVPPSVNAIIVGQRTGRRGVPSVGTSAQCVEADDLLWIHRMSGVQPSR